MGLCGRTKEHTLQSLRQCRRLTRTLGLALENSGESSSSRATTKQSSSSPNRDHTQQWITTTSANHCVTSALKSTRESNTCASAKKSLSGACAVTRKPSTNTIKPTPNLVTTTLVTVCETLLKESVY